MKKIFVYLFTIGLIFILFSWYELAGSYKLTDDELATLIKAINLKKLYKLDPKEDHTTMDGTGKRLYIYGEDDEILKKVGGYEPRNKQFLDMYNAVNNSFHVEENHSIRQARIDKLKEETGEKADEY